MKSNKKKVLLVDNDEDWLSLLNRFFTAQGYEVLAVQDCAGAIKAAALNLPHCVIADLRMGAENGMDLCCCIKSNPKLKNIPVIILSGMDEVPGNSGCSCDAFICKSDGLARLLSSVKKILSE